MGKGFCASVLLAAGLAGCGATPVEHRNYREIGPGEGMLSDTLTWEWRRKGTPPSSAAQATAAEQEDFKKWRDSASTSERREFEEWRAWREWKAKNPK